MKHFCSLFIGINLLILSTGLVNKVYSQCNINTCGVTFSADTIYFDAANQALEITNINWGQLSCYTTNMQIGLDVYIYQILPNGSRSEACNVLNPFPDNLTGYVNFDFGSDALCRHTFNLDTITIDSSDGFYPCDGALYEVELALYVTVDTAFLNSGLTANNHLHSDEYLMYSLGFVETHITNTFPGNGQPLLLNELSQWDTGINDTIWLNCNEDVELFMQGQSLLGNCEILSDFTAAIPSQTTNIFIYSVNGNPPQLVMDTTLTYSGGQLSDIQANNYCYGGILTHTTPYVFSSTLLNNPCDGTTVTLTLYTHDGFTNQLQTSKLTLVYREACVDVINLHEIPIISNIYSAGQHIFSKGTVASNDTIMMKAGERITLQTGFKAEAGSMYRAEIEPCE